MTLVISPNPDDEVPLCTCCAGSPGVRGEVFEDGAAVAVYFAEPAGMPKFPMLRLGLVLGRFTDDARPRDRVCLVFVCRRGAEGVQMEPGEPYLPTFPEFAQLGVRVTPEALAARADAGRLAQIAGAVIERDDRLAEMRPDLPGRPARRRHSITAAD